jgi:hypothetical protein
MSTPFHPEHPHATLRIFPHIVFLAVLSQPFRIISDICVLGTALATMIDAFESGADAAETWWASDKAAGSVDGGAVVGRPVVEFIGVHADVGVKG